ncbi:hypothetical protein HPB50_021686 [Hyalomma asiaticum]|uniref:Uncharacterized protein n=1 Tax=Hyalomma asiaticum TaxID=266040 RepID=A0ACB7TBC8_HYAAI|nr:hypothetical protein HPB50_021686 [Hyalomma asiaticum]
MASDDPAGQSSMEIGHGDPSNVRLADLEGIRGIFSGELIDHALSCTATEDQACQIVRRVSVWNEVFSQAKLQLRQNQSRRSGMAMVSVKSPYVRDHSPSMLHQAATLLYHVLKRHRCLTHLEVTIRRLNLYDQLLCDALRGHEHIETLYLRDPSERCLNPHENFCAIIPTLRNLKFFECTISTDCRPPFVEALTSLLLTTRSLTSLHVPNLLMNRRDSEAFLTAVATCSSLIELSLNFGILTNAQQQCCVRFADYLKNRTALTKLSLLGHNFLYSACMQLVLRAISENRTITTLEFKITFRREQRIHALADILSKNTTLRSLHIVSRCPYPSTDADVWGSSLTAVIENKALQELTLPFHIWTTHQWVQFSNALSTKPELKKVSVLGDTDNAVALQQICEAVRASGAEEKVIFMPFLGAHCYCSAFHFLKYKCFQDIVAFHPDSDDEAPPFRAFLHQLCSLNHVTSLTVQIEPRTCSENVSFALSDYIGTTTTLKKLVLFSVSIANKAELAWPPVIDSLARNGSLSELSVTVNCMDGDSCERFADVVKNSDTIRRFSFYLRHGFHEARFVSRMSQGIRGNYSLVKIKLPHYMDKDTFAILDAVRRNSDLVACASQFFAGGRRDKLVAASLERVYRHRALLEELAENHSVSVVEVAPALRKQVRAIEDMHEYMRLAGVVKDQVTCHPRPDGRVQLDDLNEHCWIAIRRYLMLDDVADDCAD